MANGAAIPQDPTRSFANLTVPTMGRLLNLSAIWALTRGHPSIRIAVLDGPVDQSHPCFQGANLVEHRTLAQGGAEPGPASHHGTHVASILFGQHDSPVRGVAPACSGLVLPVFADGPKNSPLLCSQLDLARAILQAVDLGAHLINISGGQLTPDGEPDPLLAKAIAACRDHNVLVIAAAGNDGCDCQHVPAALDRVLPVGAVDADGEPLQSSNWGTTYRTRGIVAPGENIPVAQPGGGLCTKTGTSYAAPLVSGVAGLLLSVQVERGERPNPEAVRRALIASATPCDPDRTEDCRRVLAGRLNVTGALKLVIEGVNMSETIAADRSENATTDLSEVKPVATGRFLAAGAPSIAVAAPRPSAGVSPSEIADAADATSSGATPASFRAAASVKPSIGPSDCGCGGGGAACSCGGRAVQLVYALGKLGYDFGTEARRDSFVQAMSGDAPNPHDAAQMAEYLRSNPFEAESLIWTLSLDATPIYAIVPAGPFAANAHERLRHSFEGQIQRGVELVSIPGTIAGSVTLMSGQTVPTIIPAVRGMFSWAMTQLIQSVVGERPRAAADRETYEKRVGSLNSFLSRVYYDLRNLGLTAQERALNFSATNAFQVSQVMASAAQGDLELDTINVRKSPVCRPDSDCYDIEIGFFDPRNVNVATKIYRFTVDVSDVMPVTIGDVRAWSRRG